MSNRPYFTLAVRNADGNWSAEFGDYDKANVESERDDYRDGSQGIKAKDMKIVRTADNQAAINAAIIKLNTK